jgi:hypothetical protein
MVRGPDRKDSVLREVPGWAVFRGRPSNGDLLNILHIEAKTVLPQLRLIPGQAIFS